MISNTDECIYEWKPSQHCQCQDRTKQSHLISNMFYDLVPCFSFLLNMFCSFKDSFILKQDFQSLYFKINQSLSLGISADSHILPMSWLCCLILACSSKSGPFQSVHTAKISVQINQVTSWLLHIPFSLI